MVERQDDEVDLRELVQRRQVAHYQPELGVADAEVLAHENFVIEGDWVVAVLMVGACEFSSVALEDEGVRGCFKQGVL